MIARAALKSVHFFRQLRKSLSKGYVHLMRFTTISKPSACLCIIIHLFQLMGLSWSQGSSHIDTDSLYKILFIILTTLRGRAETIEDLLDSDALTKLFFFILLIIVVALFSAVIYVMAIFNRAEKASHLQEGIVRITGYTFIIFEWIIYLPIFNLSLFFLSCGDNHPNGECFQTRHVIYLLLGILGIFASTILSFAALYFHFIPYFVIKNHLARQDLLTRYVRYAHLTLVSIFLRLATVQENLGHLIFVLNILAGLIYLNGVRSRFEFISFKVSYIYAILTPFYCFAAIIGYVDWRVQAPKVTYSILFLLGGALAASAGKILHVKLYNKMLMGDIISLTSPRHVDNVCRLLWEFLDRSSRDRQSALLYISYVKSHIDRCQDMACYCKKCNIIAGDYDKKVKGPKNLFDIDPEIALGFLKGFIGYWYEKSSKERFPKSFDLFVSFMNFITEIQCNYIMAWLYTADRKAKVTSHKEELLLLSIRENIEKKILKTLITDEYNHHTPYTVMLECEEKIDVVRRDIKAALKEYIELFKSLDRDQLDLNTIDKNCKVLVARNKKVMSDLYRIIMKTEFSSHLAREYYFYYTELVMGENGAQKFYNQEHDRYRRLGFNLEDYFKENMGVVIASLENGKVGQIEGANREFANLFKHKQTDLYGKNISSLMPDMIGSRHTRFMERFLNYSKNLTLNHESFLSFGQSKGKFVVPLTIRARVEIMNEKVYMSALCDGTHKNRYFILLNSSSKIISVTENFMQKVSPDGKIGLQDIVSLPISCIMPTLGEIMQSRRGIDDEMIYQESYLVMAKDTEGLESFKQKPNWMESKLSLDGDDKIKNILELLKTKRVNVFQTKFNLTKVAYPRSKITMKVLEILSFQKVRDYKEFIEEEDYVPSLGGSSEIQFERSKSKSKPTVSTIKFDAESPLLKKKALAARDAKRKATELENSLILPENFTIEDTDAPLVGLSNLEYKFIETMPDKNKTLMSPKLMETVQGSVDLLSGRNTESKDLPQATVTNTNANEESPLKKLRMKSEKSFKWKKLGLETLHDKSNNALTNSGTFETKVFDFNTQNPIRVNTFKMLANVADLPATIIPSLTDDKKSENELPKAKSGIDDDILSLEVEHSRKKEHSKFDPSNRDSSSYTVSLTKREVIESVNSLKLPLFLRTFKLSGILAILGLIVIYTVGFVLLYLHCNEVPSLKFVAEFATEIMHPIGTMTMEVEKRLMYSQGTMNADNWTTYFESKYHPAIEQAYSQFKSLQEQIPTFYKNLVGAPVTSFQLDITTIDELGRLPNITFEFLSVLRQYEAQMYKIVKMPDDEWSMMQMALHFFRENTPSLIQALISSMNDSFQSIQDDLDSIHLINALLFWISVAVSAGLTALMIPVTFVIRRKTNEILCLFKAIPSSEIKERLSYYEFHLAEFERLGAELELNIDKFEKFSKQSRDKQKLQAAKDHSTVKRKKVKTVPGPFLYAIFVVAITWGIILLLLIWQYIGINSFLQKAKPTFSVLETFNALNGIFPNFIGLQYARMSNEIQRQNFNSTGGPPPGLPPPPSGSGSPPPPPMALPDYEVATQLLLKNLTSIYIGNVNDEMAALKDDNSESKTVQTLAEAVRETDMCMILDLTDDEYALCENGLFVSQAKSFLAVIQQSYRILADEMDMLDGNDYNQTLIEAFVNSETFAENDKYEDIIAQMIVLVIDTFSKQLDNSLDGIKILLVVEFVIGIFMYAIILWIIWLPFVRRMNTSISNARQNLLLLPIEIIYSNKVIMRYFNREGILQK